MGGIRPARQAGSSEAASVTTKPITMAIATEPAETVGAASSIGPADLTQESVSAARPAPPRTPSKGPKPAA